jgi:hypothetical protein
VADFGEPDGAGQRLASDLRDDLAQAGHRSDAVALSTSLRDFVGEQVEAHDEDSEIARQWLSEGDHRAAVAEEVLWYLAAFPSTAAESLLGSVDVETVEWTEGDIQAIEVMEAHEFADGDLLVYLQARVSGSLEFALDRETAGRLPRGERQLFAVMTGDTAEGTKAVDAQVDIELITNPDGSIEGLAVTDMREVLE